MQKAFEKTHQSVNIVFFIAIFVTTLIFAHPFFVMTSFIAAFLTASYYLSFKTTIKTLLYILPFGLFSLIIMPIVSQQGTTELFWIGSRVILIESVLLTLSNFLIFTSILMWFMVFNKIMTTDKIQSLFGARMPKLALLVTMTLRFFPRLKSQIAQIHISRKMLLIKGKKLTLKEKMTEGIRTFSTLFSWSLEDGLDTADIMRAKGYDLQDKTQYKRQQTTKSTFIYTCILVLMLLLLCIAYFNSSFYYAYIPVFTFSYSWQTLIMLLMFTILQFFPLILEGIGELAWHFYQSKI